MIARYLVVLAGSVIFVPTAAAQMVVSISVPPDNNSTLLVQGSTIAFPATAIGSSTLATLTFFNPGPQDASVNGIAIGGANLADFGLVNSPLFPIVLQKGQVQAIGLKFSPSQAVDSRATMTIVLNSPMMTLSLVGRTANPRYVLTYTDTAAGNVIPLSSGAQVTFPAVQVGNMLDVTFSAHNTGIGPGTLDSVSVSGPDFLVINRPLLPAVIAPGGVVNFGVRFRPTSSTTSPASTTLVAILGGNTYNIAVSASVFIPPTPTSAFAYTFSSSSGPASVTPGTSISVPDTNVGSQTSMILTVSNTGDGSGNINTVTVQGSAFTVDNVPALPLSLGPGKSQQFTLTFSPRSPDKFTGNISIGNDTFPFTGVGLGSRLQLMYLQGSTPVVIPENGTIAFPALSVGSTTSLNIQVTNTGTVGVQITGVVPNSEGAAYSVASLPLPITLAPGDGINFPLTFAPGLRGQTTGTLSVNTTNWNLSGLGTPPPDLPSFHIDTDSTNVSPLTQPILRLSLDTSYSMPVTGTLTLSMVTAPHGVDPAVQWITGGQTVAFSIPAGTTTAMFSGGRTDVGLQVGTVAGSIAITPTFQLNSGYKFVDSSPDLMLTVPAIPPQLLDAQLQSVTSTSFSLNVVGYSTTKQLGNLTFQFTPFAGTTLSASQVQIDVSANALVYYHSPSSQPFGGLFSLTVPIVLSTNQTTTDSLLAKIQTITVTVSNDQGESPPLVIRPNSP
jgi:hypothetical protein